MPDNTRMRTLLGVTPKVSLREGTRARDGLVPPRIGRLIFRGYNLRAIVRPSEIGSITSSTRLSVTAKSLKARIAFVSSV